MSNERKTLRQLSSELKEGKFSSRELAEAYLERAQVGAERTRSYIDVHEEDALAAADESDRRRSAGKTRGWLDGLPLAVKDNLLVSGRRTTAGSNIIRNYVAPYDSTVVTRLKDEGAVILGKTNLDEFAMGSSTESSCHGPTKNPWDVERVPGGSSGGSAAAVAEDSAPAAIGSDTGGSVRQPASLCGVVGLKPTYGRVSRYGLIALASSLDQVGPVTRSVEDAAGLLRTIEGRDPQDSTSVELSDNWRLPENLDRPLKGMRFGLPKEYFVSGMEPGVEKTVRAAIDRLVENGAEIKEVELPHSRHALAVYYLVMDCEASANLSRFDGMRYGERAEGSTLEETYRQSRGRGFGPEARRRIMLGTYALSSGYYDAYYLRSLKVRRLIADDFTRALADVDCLLAPTSPVVAWKLGEMTEDPLAMYLQDIYTVSVNVAGLPAISLPCGLSDGLPVGLQMIGRKFDERTLLQAAHAFEVMEGGFSRYVPPSGVNH